MDAVLETQMTPSPADYSDEELIGAYHAGESWMKLDDLFQVLVQRHRARLTQWCLRYCHDRDGAADLTQEVFLKAFRNLHNFRGDSKFSTWLYVITRNHCLNATTKPGLQASFVDHSTAENVADPSHRNTVSWLEAQQERQVLWSTISEVLSRTEARVMMMHYGDEVPLATVSSHLGLTNRSGAKAYIVSARRKLEVAFRQRRSAGSRRQA